jgi:hypothetical protein
MRCRGAECFRVLGVLGSSLRLDGATLSDFELAACASRRQNMTVFTHCRDSTRLVLALEKETGTGGMFDPMDFDGCAVVSSEAVGCLTLGIVER